MKKWAAKLRKREMEGGYERYWTLQDFLAFHQKLLALRQQVCAKAFFVQFAGGILYEVGSGGSSGLFKVPFDCGLDGKTLVYKP